MATPPKFCRRCGKPATDKRPISRKGNCPPCGIKATKAAMRGNKGGAHLVDPVVRQKWLEGMARAVERAANAAVESAQHGADTTA